MARRQPSLFCPRIPSNEPSRAARGAIPWNRSYWPRTRRRPLWIFMTICPQNSSGSIDLGSSGSGRSRYGTYQVVWISGFVRYRGVWEFQTAGVPLSDFRAPHRSSLGLSLSLFHARTMGWYEASKFSGEAMTIVQYSNLILRAVQMRCTKRLVCM